MFVMVMQSHQALMGAQPVDFRKVPEHSPGPQPWVRVTGAPEVGERAGEETQNGGWRCFNASTETAAAFCVCIATAGDTSA